MINFDFSQDDVSGWSASTILTARRQLSWPV